MDRSLITQFPGIQIATSGTSAQSALPTDSSGVAARRIRIAATAAAWVRTGSGTPTAVAGDLLVQPGDAVELNVPTGHTNIAALQVAAAGVVSVTSIENT